MKDEFVRRAVVKRWIDGDTVKVLVDLGFGVWQSATLRIVGVDCPERGTEGYGPAKFFASSIAPKDSEITVQTVKPGDASGQSFGRWLARVWAVDGRNVADVLIANGYGEAA
jgi:endonuclease YncB( thermonuclease family)